MIARRKPIPRKARVPKQRKTTRAALGRLADRLWSQIVRSRGECECCGKRPPAVVLQGAHGFSRRYRGTRWALINGFCLSSGCHVRFTHDPLGWDNFLREAWGSGVYEELRRVALKPAKDLDLAAVVARLKAEVSK